MIPFPIRGLIICVSVCLVSLVPLEAAALKEDEQYGVLEVLLSSLSLLQKLNYVRGQIGTDGYVGRVSGERVSVRLLDNTKKTIYLPPLKMNDGPQGFRTGNPVDMLLNSGSSTQWPSSMCVASSFDTDAVMRYAEALAAEFDGKGANVLLGPGVTLAREPLNGRTWEYLSGEDPILGAVLGRAYLDGVSKYTA